MFTIVGMLFDFKTILTKIKILNLKGEGSPHFQ